MILENWGNNVAFVRISIGKKVVVYRNVRNMTNLVHNDLVRGVPKLRFDGKMVCGACNQGKQVKVQHKKVPDVQASAPLDLIHMDLMGPMQKESIGGKKYVFVLVDDYTRFTWVRFIRENSETVESFKILALQLINERGGIKKIRSDHGGEFENGVMMEFCEQKGISHQFAAPRTPQHNGVVERKNMTLQEMARAMIHGNKIPQRFWAEALSTACYIINRVYVRKGTTKTPYEMWNGKTPNIGYFHVFGCRCYILNDKDYLGKFDSRSDEGIFLGYSGTSTAYRVYNKRSAVIVESVNVVFDDMTSVTWEQWESDEDTEKEKNRVSDKAPEESETEGAVIEPEVSVHQQVIQQVHRNHSVSDVIRGVEEGRKTRGKVINFRDMVQFACFVSVVEPKTHTEALRNEYWIVSMEEELEQFTRNDVWELVA